MNNPTSRQQALEHWLAQHCQLPASTLLPLANDASFRRYFRVQTQDQSFVAMDAPPEKENCRPFVAIAKTLRNKGLNAPEILASDVEQGFLLLTDFGDQVFLNLLNHENADQLYGQALEALLILQTCHTVDDWTLPHFDREFILREMQLVQEWFFERHLNLQFTVSQKKILMDMFQRLAKSADEQPRVCMHRDYHSGNLMWLPDGKVGLLDFQDAFIGPLTYDLVSLLRDCYIDWPPEDVMRWTIEFCDQLKIKKLSHNQFLDWFDLMGVQRHLKALLTFARKFHRDENANYLKFMPRVLQYLDTVCARHDELADFHQLLEDTIFPAFSRVKTTCAQ